MSLGANTIEQAPLRAVFPSWEGVPGSQSRLQTIADMINATIDDHGIVDGFYSAQTSAGTISQERNLQLMLANAKNDQRDWIIANELSYRPMEVIGPSPQEFIPRLEREKRDMIAPMGSPPMIDPSPDNWNPSGYRIRPDGYGVQAPFQGCDKAGGLPSDIDALDGVTAYGYNRRVLDDDLNRDMDSRPTPYDDYGRELHFPDSLNANAPANVTPDDVMYEEALVAMLQSVERRKAAKLAAKAAAEAEQAKQGASVAGGAEGEEKKAALTPDEVKRVAELVVDAEEKDNGAIRASFRRSNGAIVQLAANGGGGIGGGVVDAYAVGSPWELEQGLLPEVRKFRVPPSSSMPSHLMRQSPYGTRRPPASYAESLNEEANPWSDEIRAYDTMFPPARFATSVRTLVDNIKNFKDLPAMRADGATASDGVAYLVEPEDQQYAIAVIVAMVIFVLGVALMIGTSASSSPGGGSRTTYTPVKLKGKKSKTVVLVPSSAL